MGIGAIPLTEYEAYFHIQEIVCIDERLEYLRFVGALDSEFLKFQEEKSKTKNAGSSKAGKKSGKSVSRMPNRK